MKEEKKRRLRGAWAIAWVLQVIAMLIVSAGASVSIGASVPLYNLALWIAVPACGALTACAAVRFGGLLNYTAWVAPPACLFLAHYLIWGFAPPAGPALLCAFVSLVGAAAGEVLRQHKNQK